MLIKFFCKSFCGFCQVRVNNNKVATVFEGKLFFKHEKPMKILEKTLKNGKFLTSQDQNFTCNRIKSEPKV